MVENAGRDKVMAVEIQAHNFLFFSLLGSSGMKPGTGSAASPSMCQELTWLMLTCYLWLCVYVCVFAHMSTLKMQDKAEQTRHDQ